MVTPSKRKAVGCALGTPITLLFWFHRDTSALIRNLWKTELRGDQEAIEGTGTSASFLLLLLPGHMVIPGGTWQYHAWWQQLPLCLT